MTDLKETLRLHKLWLEGDDEGKRANLRGADLPPGKVTFIPYGEEDND